MIKSLSILVSSIYLVLAFCGAARAVTINDIVSSNYDLRLTTGIFDVAFTYPRDLSTAEPPEITFINGRRSIVDIYVTSRGKYTDPRNQTITFNSCNGSEVTSGVALIIRSDTDSFNKCSGTITIGNDYIPTDYSLSFVESFSFDYLDLTTEPVDRFGFETYAYRTTMIDSFTSARTPGYFSGQSNFECSDAAGNDYDCNSLINQPSVVPLPASGSMLLLGAFGLIALGRRYRHRTET